LALTPYEWIYGVTQIAVVVLSFFAGGISFSLFSSATKKLYPWKFLLVSLILFSVVIIFGVLRTFGVYDVGPWTHITVGFILAFLIASLVAQIMVAKGWLK